MDLKTSTVQYFHPTHNTIYIYIWVYNLPTAIFISFLKISRQSSRAVGVYYLPIYYYYDYYYCMLVQVIVYKQMTA